MDKYIAEFPLKHGRMVARSYKSLTVAMRAVEKAKGRYQGPWEFNATVSLHDDIGIKKTLIMEING